MANTGRKIYTLLRQRFTLSKVYTGITKPNNVGDPNYISPIEDIVSCPLPTMVIVSAEEFLGGTTIGMEGSESLQLAVPGDAPYNATVSIATGSYVITITAPADSAKIMTVNGVSKINRGPFTGNWTETFTTSGNSSSPIIISITKQALRWRGQADTAICVPNNLGTLEYIALEEYFVDSLMLTGRTKSNAPSDPDYIPPTTNYAICPTTTSTTTTTTLPPGTIEYTYGTLLTGGQLIIRNANGIQIYTASNTNSAGTTIDDILSGSPSYTVIVRAPRNAAATINVNGTTRTNTGPFSGVWEETFTVSTTDDIVVVVTTQTIEIIGSSPTCVKEGGLNTGQARYTNIQPIFELSGGAAGPIRPNAPSDPDYIPPYEDTVACPIEEGEPFYYGLMSANNDYLYIKRGMFVQIDRYLISDLESNVVDGEVLNVGSFVTSPYDSFTCSGNYLFAGTSSFVHRLNLTNTTSQQVANARNIDSDIYQSGVRKLAVINGGTGTLVTKVDTDFYHTEDLKIRKYSLSTINGGSFTGFGSDDTSLNASEGIIGGIVSTPSLIGVYWYNGINGFVLQLFDVATLTTQLVYNSDFVFGINTVPRAATTNYRGGLSGQAFFIPVGTYILVVYEDGQSQQINLPDGFSAYNFTYGINHNPSTSATLYLNYSLGSGIGRIAKCEGTVFTWIN